MNKKSKEDNTRNRVLRLAPFFLFSSALVFLYLAWRPGLIDPLPPLTPTDQVNFNLQKTLQRQELDQLRLQQEHFSKFKTRDPRPVKKNLEEESLSFEYDRTSESTAATLDGQALKHSLPSVDEVVQTQLFNDFMIREQNEKIRREYARQFVENARRAGIEIKLTQDLRIRSVRRMTSSVPPGFIDLRSGSGSAQ